jgi:hypothetical protein
VYGAVVASSVGREGCVGQWVDDTCDDGGEGGVEHMQAHPQAGQSKSMREFSAIPARKQEIARKGSTAVMSAFFHAWQLLSATKIAQERVYTCRGDAEGGSAQPCPTSECRANAPHAYQHTLAARRGPAADPTGPWRLRLHLRMRAARGR